VIEEHNTFRTECLPLNQTNGAKTIDLNVVLQRTGEFVEHTPPRVSPLLLPTLLFVTLAYCSDPRNDLPVPRKNGESVDIIKCYLGTGSGYRLVPDFRWF
jgi:hypothetical protein